MDVFRRTVTQEARKAEVLQVATRNPHRVAMVLALDKSLGDPKVFHKFVMQDSTTVAALLNTMRKRLVMTLADGQSVFVFFRKHVGKTVTDTLVPLTWTLDAARAAHASDDGILYVFLCGENTFGAP